MMDISDFSVVHSLTGWLPEIIPLRYGINRCMKFSRYTLSFRYKYITLARWGLPFRECVPHDICYEIDLHLLSLNLPHLAASEGLVPPC